MRPVHQWRLLGETTGEPGPFGGPNNNVNGRVEGQEAQPDRPVLRKAIFSKGGRWKKNNDRAYFSLKHPHGLLPDDKPMLSLDACTQRLKV